MTGWPTKSWKEGFDGRVFLTEAEWCVFLRNCPVRYTDRQLLKPTCSHCAEAGNRSTLQLAHVIPFKNGVQFLALTPDFLNGSDNLVSAHRGRCNRGAELGLEESLRRLRSLGVTALPDFLLPDVLETWKKISKSGATTDREVEMTSV